MIRENPLAYLQSVFQSAAWLWLPRAGVHAGMKSKLLQFLWTLLDLAVSLAWWLLTPMICSLAVAIRCRRLRTCRERKNFLPLAQARLSAAALMLAMAIILYTTSLIAVVGPGTPRLRMPLSLLILFGVFLSAWRLKEMLGRKICRDAANSIGRNARAT